MSTRVFIKKGKAVIIGASLRCQKPWRKKSKDGTSTAPEKPCNKLMARKNDEGQLAGEFKCERCGALVEVELIVRVPQPLKF